MIKHSQLNRFLFTILLTSLVLIIPILSPMAFAQELGSDTKEWRFDFVPYIWITSMAGQMTVRGRTVDIDASFGDILENSDLVFGLNGILAARKGKWGVYLDGTYLNMATDDSQLGPLTVSTRSQLGYFEFGGLYRLGEGVWGEDWQEDKTGERPEMVSGFSCWRAVDDGRQSI